MSIIEKRRVRDKIKQRSRDRTANAMPRVCLSFELIFAAVCGFFIQGRGFDM
jgi:hypothetical protein